MGETMNTNQMAELEQMEWQRTNPQQSSPTIQELHAEVWAFRREMAAYFPTPNQADSLAFAFTEVAEAVDATLRLNPIYKRNQSKAHGVERELAQCAMMLLTAVPELPEFQEVKAYYDLVEICYAVSVAYICPNEPKLAIHAVGTIASFIDLPLHLRAELDRMRTKHGPVQDDGPASLNAVENEHIIYPHQGEGLSLNDSEWWEESPVYKLDDYTEGMKL